MFKVYIEESALTEPQPMEVSPDAPVSRLVPALVDELQLPRTDLFGNRLVYFLRHADDGRVLPEHFSLRSAGIADEDCLSLARLPRRQPGRQRRSMPTRPLPMPAPS